MINLTTEIKPILEKICSLFEQGVDLELTSENDVQILTYNFSQGNLFFRRMTKNEKIISRITIFSNPSYTYELSLHGDLYYKKNTDSGLIVGHMNRLKCINSNGKNQFEKVLSKNYERNANLINLVQMYGNPILDEILNIEQVQLDLIHLYKKL